ncbi:DUF1295 domain-containing protein, partial [bacterium]|nr:DUF1295 domain-containing protein [bacterium]
GRARPRRWLVAGLAAAWGIRLGLHLLGRVRRDAEEDVRYRAMRDTLGDRVQPVLFGFFQLQAAWIVLFALPMFLAARNAAPAFGIGDGIGVLLWIASLAGESVADRQLARFRRDPANRGAVCRTGLWKYSRHPNYFFEWLHWWAYVAIGLGGPQGWLTLAGPAVMFVFLWKITGIPLLEERLVASRGDAYRAYQRSTSAFLPWRPRRSP